ncbi:MAG: phospho-sugar mutase [Bacteroidales bacterium]|jgi:phosphoglucomutase|nr:phospho-sugar mutase [Bacteroidales bacterium]MBR6278521.1 phospho-sugar mutase [Bacteroidales bacterium]
MVMAADAQIIERAKEWLSDKFDEETKNQVKNLLENNEKELVECFYKNLEFGTGGMRGIMGVGTNRMNVYTVGMATQGLANYLNKTFQGQEIKVAIAHDSRNNSALFAKTCADIFSANGIKAYLFNSLRPVPELSFAVRQLGCKSGVMITASHNPKEYNGYKAYWSDGAQVVAPHDKNIVDEASKVKVSDVKFKGNPSLIETLDEEFDKIYLERIKGLTLSQEDINKHKDIKIVYTPIHGSGVRLVPEILKMKGFENISVVQEQCTPDGNFPTVISPNPENAEALTLAIKLANEKGADLVMATDPDADRVGIAVRNNNNEFVLMNGNQTAAILTYYLLTKWKENGKLDGNQYIVKTIVTTELLKAMADKFGVKCYDVLTGFKFIADVIRNNEGKTTFIGGGEESYGYLAGEFVRDKDAVNACSLIAEAAAWAAEKGKTMYQLLLDIYSQYGYYRESLVNVVKEGKSGAEEIQKMMDDYRNDPPAVINDSNVVMIKDYLTQKASNILDGTDENIDLPKSNVLQFFLEDGTKISVRPSGTEPKIKFYFGVKEGVKDISKLDATEKAALDKIETIKKAMHLA